MSSYTTELCAGALSESEWLYADTGNNIHTCELRDGAPAAVAVLGNVVHELLVLLGRPEPSPQLLLVAARLLRHAGRASQQATNLLNPVDVVGRPRSLRRRHRSTSSTMIDHCVEEAEIRWWQAARWEVEGSRTAGRAGDIKRCQQAV